MRTVPSPVSWPASPYWDGNDGVWNSFVVQVGTPPQAFRILPSTAGQETWVPVPAGCTSRDLSDPDYCGYLRGTLPGSAGFEVDESSTWEAIGIYTLDAQEAKLGYGGNGQYGYDTVVMGPGHGVARQIKQVVAGIADPDFWLGVFGLGPKSINFTTLGHPVPSYMSELVTNDDLPSLSWGYTAGAFYKNNASASLTLGGYDENRIEPGGLTFDMNADTSRPLQVGVQSIIVNNPPQGEGAISLLSSGIYEFIDSTLPHIRLPDEAIDRFISTFGLTYDNRTDLFLINDTMRQRNLEAVPTVSFQLGPKLIAGPATDTVSIKMPYAAFDLQASYPFYETPTSYFPIRRAANQSQYTIGRTFFQEAYVVADFERGNFTVAQAAFDKLDSPQLVAIKKPNVMDKLSGGVIAGIVVGALAALLLAILVVFLFRRRSRGLGPERSSGVQTEWYSYDEKRAEDSKMSRASQELDSLPRSELPSPDMRKEHYLSEAPGGEVKPSELPGSEPGGKYIGN